MEAKLYIGSFQSNSDAAILRSSFNDLTGEITVIDRLNAPRPSWLSTDGEGRLLFAMECGEIDGIYGGSIGLVDLKSEEFLLKNKLSIGSKGPTHLCYYDGRIYASCYAEGSLVEANLCDGDFTGEVKTYRHEGKSVHPTRQDRPHPHFSLITPDGKHLAVCDLGLDKIMLYPIAEKGGIAGGPHAFPAPSGTGPRHAVFSPDGRFMYVVCEMGCNILTYAYNEGELTLVDSVSTLDCENIASQCGAIRINKEGRELIVTNRGSDTIAFFSIEKDGRLKPNGSVKTAEWPRDACFSPSGKWLLVAGQQDDSIKVYSYSYSKDTPPSERVKPVCVTSLDKGINPSSILFAQ